VGNEFTAADIQMSFPLENAMERADLDASRPKLMEWLDRIHARPVNNKSAKMNICWRSLSRGESNRNSSIEKLNPTVSQRGRIEIIPFGLVAI
jgi:hypothetical protein